MKKIFSSKALIIFLLLISLTPIKWFFNRPGILINGVDTNFPLNPSVWFFRRFYVWNPVSGAGIDFSSSTAGIFFHFLQFLPFKLGLSLQQVQITSLVFWFAFIVLSSFMLSKLLFPKNKLVQLLFVCLYSFNIYLFNSWENVKVANLSLVSAIPLGLAILIAKKENKISLTSFVLSSAISGIIVSGTGINPAYLISFFLLISIFIFSETFTNLTRKKIKTNFTNFLIFTIVILLTNSFWAFPTAYNIFKNISPENSLNQIGFTSWVNSLSENTSIVNVIRMQGAWDWYAFDQVTGLPLYIPYALKYFYSLPFIVFSFILPTLALVSFLFKKKAQNSLYVSFGVMFMIGIFLDTGTHPPTGEIFHWMTMHVPFFSLFRSPWYIFTPLISLSTAGLISLFFYNITKINKSISYFGILVIIIGNFFYSYPLVTGKIFRPSKKDGFYVTFPNYIYDSAKWLSDQGNSRVIGYPDDEIERFDWGYSGTESILSLLSTRETLFAPLNATNSPVSQLTKEYYDNLKKGEINSSDNIAKKLGIGLIFEKKDQSSLTPSLPNQITSLEKNTFGLWNFYKTTNPPLPKIFSATSLTFSYPYDKSSQIISLTKENSALANPLDNIVKKINLPENVENKIILSTNSQEEDFHSFVSSPSILSNRLLRRDLSSITYTLEVPKDGQYQPHLENYNLQDFGISNKDELQVSVNGESQNWAIESENDSYITFKPINFKKGTQKIVIKINNNNLVSNSNYFELLNTTEKDISKDFVISSFDPFIPYYVEVEYQQIYGNNASVLAGQSKGSTLVKTQVERLPNYPQMHIFSFFYNPVKTDSQMKVLLASPSTKDPLGTKIIYNNLNVYKIFTNKLVFTSDGSVNLSMPNIEILKSSPTNYKIKVTNASSPHIIVFSDNYSDDWKFTKSNTHFTANFYANAWYVQNAPDEYEAEIYYLPQKLFIFGACLSIVTFMFSVIFILTKTWKKLIKK